VFTSGEVVRGMQQWKPACLCWLTNMCQQILPEKGVVDLCWPKWWQQVGVLNWLKTSWTWDAQKTGHWVQT